MLLALILCLVLAVSSVVPVCAAGLDFDYSDPTAEKTVKTDIASMLSAMMPGYFDTATLAFFEENGISFSYSVPTEKLVSVKTFTSGSVTVCADVYEYTANGKSFKWIPVSAEADGVTAAFEYDGESYTAVLTELPAGNSRSVKLTYTAEAEVTSEEATLVASLPYEAGTAAALQLKEYNSLLDAYNKKVEEYNRIVAPYADELAAYEDYEKKLGEYNDAVKGYEDYVKALEEYKKVIASYASYIAALNEYKKTAPAYGAYKAGMEIASAKLCVIESAFVLMKNIADGKQLPSAFDRIMGNSVTSVLANKEDLIKAGIDERDINIAASSTESLRKYLTEYAALETIEEKFAYYKTNYILIKTNFTKLNDILVKFNSNKVVRAEMANREKTLTYEQFLGQLAMICAGFENTDASSPTSITLPEAVRDNGTDLSGFPAKGEYVSEDVFASLTVPVYKIKSTAEAPDPVSRPDVPDFSEYVGESPVAPELSEIEKTLAALVEEGSLEKPVITENVILPLTYTFETTFKTLRGDMNIDGKVNTQDAVYLLRHTMRASKYPLDQGGDVNGDSEINSADAIYLLRFTLRPKTYPLS